MVAFKDWGIESTRIGALHRNFAKHWLGIMWQHYRECRGVSLWWCLDWRASHGERLDRLGLSTLKQRRRRGDLREVYKTERYRDVDCLFYPEWKCQILEGVAFKWERESWKKCRQITLHGEQCFQSVSLLYNSMLSMEQRRLRGRLKEVFNIMRGIERVVNRNVPLKGLFRKRRT